MFNEYMQIAISVAKKQSKQNNEIPVGCVIVDNNTGKILAQSCNKTIKKNSPIQHAEIVCINRALKKKHTNRLCDCSMYITLEPCIMCSGAIALAKIEKIYIGCLSEKTGAVISNLSVFNQKICNHKPYIYYPIMEQECKTLMRNFFKKLHTFDKNL